MPKIADGTLFTGHLVLYVCHRGQVASRMPNRFKRRITVKIIMLDTKSMPPLWRWAVRIGVVLLWAALMAAAIRYRWHQSPAYEKEIKREEAHAYFKERCKSAGIFIYQKLSGIDTIYLINTRPYRQGALDAPGASEGMVPQDGRPMDGKYDVVDPYGFDYDPMREIDGPRRYSLSFIGGQRDTNSSKRFFKAVELRDSRDGKLYQYTGEYKPVPHGNRTRMQFYDVKKEVSKIKARYGIKFKDISTAEDRFHWVAGSALSIIDLATNQVVATRIGYMWDAGMGFTGAGRKPWLMAEGNACPAFKPRGSGRWTSRNGQSAAFAIQVLNPN